MTGASARRIVLSLAALAGVAGLNSSASGQAPSAPSAPSAPREPTDLMIRRLAGLPADSAKGQIEIIDVGHMPLDTMLSIVGNRTSAGWNISYACAMSPHCAPNADHAARTYTLSATASAEVDAILETLRRDGEPDGQSPSPSFLGGNLLVSIDYKGFRRNYRRAGRWGDTLGQLEMLMKANDPAR